jgi:DUF971 family protein
MPENQIVAEGEEKRHDVVIFIDGKQFKVETEFMKGLKLRPSAECRAITNCF